MQSLRIWKSQPGFGAAVVLALALSIGANSALFTIVNALLLRPLPFPHSEQLVDISFSERDRPLQENAWPQARLLVWRIWNSPPPPRRTRRSRWTCEKHAFAPKRRSCERRSHKPVQTSLKRRDSLGSVAPRSMTLCVNTHSVLLPEAL